MSHITRQTIADFLENADQSMIGDLNALPAKVTIWKWAALQVGAASWHHTGKAYKKTAHYNLYQVVGYFRAHKETYINDYKKYLKTKKAKS